MSFGTFFFEVEVDPGPRDEEIQELAAAVIQRQSSSRGIRWPRVFGALSVVGVVVLGAMRFLAEPLLGLVVPQVPLVVLIVLAVPAVLFMIPRLFPGHVKNMQRTAALTKARQTLRSMDIHGPLVAEYSCERGTLACAWRRAGDGGVVREWSKELSEVHVALLGDHVIVLFAKTGKGIKALLIRHRDPMRRREVERALSGYENLRVDEINTELVSQH